MNRVHRRRYPGRSRDRPKWRDKKRGESVPMEQGRQLTWWFNGKSQRSSGSPVTGRNVLPRTRVAELETAKSGAETFTLRVVREGDSGSRRSPHEGGPLKRWSRMIAFGCGAKGDGKAGDRILSSRGRTQPRCTNAAALSWNATIEARAEKKT